MFGHPTGESGQCRGWLVRLSWCQGTALETVTADVNARLGPQWLLTRVVGSPQALTPGHEF
jgi:hypothetical protein